MVQAVATQSASPGAGAFAILFGLESMGRAFVTAALPIQTLEILGSDEGVSQLYLLGALTSIAMAFVIPRLALWMGRARMCSLAILGVALAYALFSFHELPTQVSGFMLRACGFALLYAGLNMFLMDQIRRHELGKSEPLRMLSVGLAWIIGPTLGVVMESLWGPWAPFAASAGALLLVLIYFWAAGFHKLSIVTVSDAPLPKNPFANLVGFLSRPRLALSWVLAIGRGIFWASFIIYTPLYAVQTGLGKEFGGYLVSLAHIPMLLMLVWGWAARRYGIRAINLYSFPVAGVALTLAAVLTDWPYVGAACIVIGAFAMIITDGYGNALFYRACKPSQRPTMTPLFSTQRDLADLIQAGTFALLLLIFPVQVVFLVLGFVMFIMTVLSFSIHKRL